MHLRKSLILLAMMLLLVACGNDTPSATQTPATPAAKATTAATIQPTHAAAPAGLVGQPGPVTLGQPLSHFVARYGQPVSKQQDVQYIFANGSLTVDLPSKDSLIAMTISYDNDGQKGWASLDAAKAPCQAFLPDDAKFTRSLTASNGDAERVYLAPSLAPLFPAIVFTDENGNNATPGTIAIVYVADVTNTSRVITCNIQVGVQG